MTNTPIPRKEVQDQPTMKKKTLTLPDFGDYVRIEQKRYGVPNEMYGYKVIGRLKSNGYVDVPVQSPETETVHDEVVDVVVCICCGIEERDVRRYRLEDVKFTPK